MFFFKGYKIIIINKELKKILIENKLFYGYTSLSLVIAIGLCAWLYLPLLNYSSSSIRTITASSDSFIYSTMWSLHPKEIITFFFPGSYGFGGTTYWGYMPFTDYPNYIGINKTLSKNVVWTISKHSWFLQRPYVFKKSSFQETKRLARLKNKEIMYPK